MIQPTKYVLAACFSVASALLPVSPGNAEPIKIAYSVISWTMSAVYMAEDAGLFKKNGLDVQIIYIPSSGTSVQALLGGSVDIITPGSSGVIIGVVRGVPMVTVAASTRRAPFTLYVQPEIIRADQLKGKVVGVSRFNSTSHMMTVLILRKLGIEEAVSVRQLGDSPAMHNAFEQKLVAAMMTAVKPRLQTRALADAVTLDIPYASSMVTVTRAYLQDHRNTVERVMRAYVEAMALLLNQKEAAKRVFAKYIRRSDPEFLEETYETARKYLEPIPRVDPRIVAPVLDYAGIKDVAAADVAAKLIDNSVLDKLQKEPLIESLFGKKK